MKTYMKMGGVVKVKITYEGCPILTENGFPESLTYDLTPLTKGDNSNGGDMEKLSKLYSMHRPHDAKAIYEQASEACKSVAKKAAGESKKRKQQADIAKMEAMLAAKKAALEAT